MKEEPLYPFGYGLSYTDFSYSNLKLSDKELCSDTDKNITVSVNVENTGDRNGDEVVQLYIKDLEASTRVPNMDLKGFKRINLDSGENTTVEFLLRKRDFALIDEDGKCYLEPGKFKIFVGGQQADTRSEKLTGKGVLEAEIEFVGDKIELEY
ncbi:MAG: fibronectin type III-like domain-contianing protein, partial [Candidatus Woesearchaeota archaeon]